MSSVVIVVIFLVIAAAVLCGGGGYIRHTWPEISRDGEALLAMGTACVVIAILLGVSLL